MAVPILAIAGLVMQGMSMAASGAASSASAKTQKKALKLQQKQYELDLKQSYLSSLDKLTQLEGEYKNTQLAIMQQQADIASSEAWLDRFSGYYAAQLGQVIDQGVPQFQALTTNWQNQLTLAAERGQTGSTARMLAAIQRQNLVNFAGEDLTLDTQGGSFGRALSEQQQDLLAEQQTVQNSIKVGQQTLGIYNDTLNDYLTSIGTTLGSAVAMGYETGMEYDQLAQLVDQYRDYFGGTDAEYDAAKKEILKQYTPLDYRVTSYTYETESGGESQHGATIREHTGYITWVKDKETGLWGQATSAQIKDLKKIYGKNYLQDYINANEVVEFGNGPLGMANNVRRQNLNNVGKPIFNDTVQKYLESLGSRPK